MKIQSYNNRDQIQMNESLDKDLIKRIEQDLKLYDLRQTNPSSKKEMLIKDNDRGDMSIRKQAFRTSDDLNTKI
jgi:hypothetical protein